MGELKLAGGKVGSGGLAEGAIEKFVVKELVGDLGKAVGRQDGDGKGEPVLGVVVVFRDRRGKALAEFYLGLKAGDAQVLGDMKVVEQDFPKGGLGFRGRVVAVAADLLEHFLRGSFGIVGLAEPVEDEEELLLHLGRGTELVQDGGVEEFLEVLFRVFDPLELAHALGRGHGIEDQVVVRRQIVPSAEKVDVGIVVVLDEKRDRSRWSGRQSGNQRAENCQLKPEHAASLKRTHRRGSR